MGNAGSFFLFWVGPPRPGKIVLARVAHLTLVGKSADHQLASPADLPTRVSSLANGTCRLVCREILPIHGCKDWLFWPFGAETQQEKMRRVYDSIRHLRYQVLVLRVRRVRSSVRVPLCCVRVMYTVHLVAMLYSNTVLPCSHLHFLFRRTPHPIINRVSRSLLQA